MLECCYLALVAVGFFLGEIIGSLITPVLCGTIQSGSSWDNLLRDPRTRYWCCGKKGGGLTGPSEVWECAILELGIQFEPPRAALVGLLMCNHMPRDFLDRLRDLPLSVARPIC